MNIPKWKIKFVDQSETELSVGFGCHRDCRPPSKSSDIKLFVGKNHLSEKGYHLNCLQK